MNSRLPYLLRATYEWIVDNNCTPYLVVDAMQPNVSVPQQFVQDGQITLNASMTATQHLEMTNEAVTFSARFSGRVEHIYVPVDAVLAIYARENGEGLVFSLGEAEGDAQLIKDDPIEGMGGALGDDSTSSTSSTPPDSSEPVKLQPVATQTDGDTEIEAPVTDSPDSSESTRPPTKKGRPSLTIVK